MTKNMQHKFGRILGVAGLFLLGALLHPQVAKAAGQSIDTGIPNYYEVVANMPSGKLQFDAVDLRIKVANGYVTWSRAYNGNHWVFSSHWTSLGLRHYIPSGGGGGGEGNASAPPPTSSETFGVVYGPFGQDQEAYYGSMLTGIVRNGAEFEADSTGIYQQKGSSSRYFIRYANENGRSYFRWQDRLGEWIEYNEVGRVVAYGNLNGLTATLEYEEIPAPEHGRRLKVVKDRGGNPVMTFVYDPTHPSILREVREVLLPGENYAPRVVKYDYDFSVQQSFPPLVKFTDPVGNPTNYGYDDIKRLTSVTDGEGHVHRIEYVGKTGRRLKEVTASGIQKTYDYAYDKLKKQYSVRTTYAETSAIGRRIIEDIYDADGIQIRKEINGQLASEFGNDGRESYRTNAAGYRTKLTANEFGLTTRIDYPDGAISTKEYSATNLRMTKHVDAGGMISKHEHDENGNITKSVQAAGTPLEREVTFINNDLGLPTQATARGRIESNGVTTPDSTFKFEYDTRGNIKKTIDAEGGVRLYVYNSNGDLVEYTDPRNNKTTFDLDANGRPLKVNAPLGQTRSFAYDKVGNLLSRTDELGNALLMSYNALSQVVRIEDGKGGSTKFTYDENGLTTSEIDADGRTQVFEYDNFKRLIKRTDAMGNATRYGYELPSEEATTSSTRAFSRFATSITYPTYSKAIKFDAAARVTSKEFVFEKLDGAGQFAQNRTYDSRGYLTRSETAGKEIRLAYNLLGEVTEIMDAAGKSTKTLRDIHGNLIQIADADGRITRFEYDRMNRRIKQVLPLGQTETYVYDATGNLIEIVNSNGNKTLLSYDALNRVIETVTLQANGDKVRTVSLGWNIDNTLKNVHDNDHSRSQINSTVYAYDELGRRNGTTVTYPNGYKLQFGYGYSAAGFKTFLNWPDGTSIRYSYSAHGVLESVGVPGEGNIQVAAYKWRTPSTTLLPGGGREQRVYDGLFNLKSLDVRASESAPANLSLEYQHDNRQNVISVIRKDVLDYSSRERKNTYELDSAERLVKVRTDNGGIFGTDTRSYVYDSADNRLSDSKIAGEWVYDANNRLQKIGTGTSATTFEYDNAGNLVRKNEAGLVTNFSYDSQNRLIEVTGGNGELIARYGYDPLDRRIWREQFRTKTLDVLEKAKRTFYLYADEGLIAEAEQEISLNGDGTIAEDTSPAIVSQYGPVPNRVFTTGVLFVKTKGSDGRDVVAYYHHDRLGTPLQATDKTGAVVWSADFDEFGRASITTPPSSPERATIVSNLRLPGQIEDAETGLHYNFRRYYDPAIGRYITSDPIGIAGGLNRYVYAGANPTRSVDPTGEFIWAIPLAAEFIAPWVTREIVRRVAPYAFVAAATFIFGKSLAPPPAEYCLPAPPPPIMSESQGEDAGTTTSASDPEESRDGSPTAEPEGIPEEGSPESDIPADQPGSDADSGAGDGDGSATGDPNDDRRPKTGKSDRHGDPNAMSKAQKQIEKLKESLKNATSRKERQQIEQKIKNITQTAQKRAKGETHWTKG
jgi:RHS repeat-associated protein